MGTMPVVERQVPAPSNIRKGRSGSCDVCRRLIEALAGVQRVWAEAEADFIAALNASAPEFQKRRILMDDAGIDFDIARLQFEKHRLIHVRAN